MGKVQAQAEGGLSERALRRAAELANDADLRLNPPIAKSTPTDADRTATVAVPHKGDNRLPLPGTVISRVYKNQTIRVRVLADGFEYEGERFKSLSAVAKQITGSHCNGFHFFREALNGNGGEA